MTIAIRVRNNGRVVAARFFAIDGKLRSQTTKALERASLLLSSAMRTSMRGSRSRAKRKGRKVTAPAGVLGIDTGKLGQSLGYEIQRAGASTLRALVGPQRVDYARIHELGGWAGLNGVVRIPRRPYIAPAIAKTKDAIQRMLGRAVRIAVSGDEGD